VINIDEIDDKIIKELSINAKISLRKLALKIGISSVTAMKRIKKLEKNGIIKSYNIIVDYHELGYEIEVLVEVKISKGKLLELEKKIARCDGVFKVYDTTGDFDATILARFKSTRKLDNFVKKIQKYDFVQRTHTKLILNTIK